MIWFLKLQIDKWRACSATSDSVADCQLRRNMEKRNACLLASCGLKANSGSRWIVDAEKNRRSKGLEQMANSACRNIRPRFAEA